MRKGSALPPRRKLCHGPDPTFPSTRALLPNLGGLREKVFLLNEKFPLIRFRQALLNCVWHRIETAFCKWTAAPQPFHCQRKSTPRAVPLNRLICIIRTGRIEFARASQERPEKNLVATDESKQQPNASRFHVRAYAVEFPPADARGSIFSNSSLSDEKFAVATVLRG